MNFGPLPSPSTTAGHSMCIIIAIFLLIAFFRMSILGGGISCISITVLCMLWI